MSHQVYLGLYNSCMLFSKILSQSLGEIGRFCHKKPPIKFIVTSEQKLFPVGSVTVHSGRVWFGLSQQVPSVICVVTIFFGERDTHQLSLLQYYLQAFHVDNIEPLRQRNSSPYFCSCSIRSLVVIFCIFSSSSTFLKNTLHFSVNLPKSGPKSKKKNSFF